MTPNRKSSASPRPQSSAAKITKPKARVAGGSKVKRGVAQQEEPVVRNGEDPGSNPGAATSSQKEPTNKEADRRLPATRNAASPDSKPADSAFVSYEYPSDVDSLHQPPETSLSIESAGDGTVRPSQMTDARTPADSFDRRSIDFEIGTIQLDPASLAVEPVELLPAMEAAVPNTRPPKRKITAVYEYTDEDANPLYEIVRYEPKDFRPRRHVGKNRYEWNLDGVRRVPYRLHEFAKSEGQTIFVVEGEKDVETARRMGLLATCSNGGANGWKQQFAEFLHKHTVVIIPDNDEAGDIYADVVSTSVDNIARDWRIVRLPDLPPKGDLTDFVEKGGTKDDILRLVAKAFSSPRAQNFALYDGADAIPRPTNGKPSQPAEPAWSISTKCFADIQPEKIDWLWNGLWINHTLNLLIGPPGVGKTFVACHLAAAVSSGTAFPDGGGVPPIGDVVYCCTEDSLAAAIRPRLEEAGANINRVFTWEAKTRIDRSGDRVEEPISLQEVELLARQIDAMPDIRLLIFDPVMAYMGNAEANDNQDVRRILEGLRKLAESKRICVLLVSHMKKGASQAINATMGAQAFTAIPRSAYMLQKDPEDASKKTRCLSPVKNNSGPDTFGKKFRLDFGPTGTGHGHIVWDAEPDQRTADEITMATLAKNSFTGRESNEEKSQTRNELAFFEVLDALSVPAGTWVPTFEIRKRLGWNGSKVAKLLWELQRSERIELRDGEKQMPGGGIQSGGREEVRRREHVVPWSAG